MLYGSGLRLAEAQQLRIKDVDFVQRQLVIRNSKGMESRLIMVPESLVDPLQGALALGAATAPAGFGAGLWIRLSTLCLGAQISTCRAEVDLAVCLSGRTAVSGSQKWYHPPSSPA